MHSFVGRQPIFDQYKKVSGYELLYRAGLDNVFPQIDGDAATTAVINSSFFDMGIQTLAGRNRAFINFSKSIKMPKSRSKPFPLGARWRQVMPIVAGSSAPKSTLKTSRVFLFMPYIQRTRTSMKQRIKVLPLLPC